MGSASEHRAVGRPGEVSRRRPSCGACSVTGADAVDFAVVVGAGLAAGDGGEQSPRDPNRYREPLTKPQAASDEPERWVFAKGFGALALLALGLIAVMFALI